MPTVTESTVPGHRIMGTRNPPWNLDSREGSCYTQNMWKNLSAHELRNLSECLHHAAMANERIEHPMIEVEMWGLWQEVRIYAL